MIKELCIEMKKCTDCKHSAFDAVGVSIVGILMCLLIAGIFFVPFSTTSNAASLRSTIKTLEAEIADIENKIQKYSNNISSAQSTIEAQLEYKAQLDETIILLSEKIEKATELVNQYDLAIADVGSNIIQKEAEVDALYESFRQWLRVIYEYGDVSYIEIILSSDDFSEFLASTERISNMMEYQNTLMENLKNEIATLDKERSSLEVYRQAGEHTKNELEKDKEKHSTLLQNAESYVAKLKSNIELWEQLQAKEKAEREAFTNELEEALLLLAQQNNAYVGGTFMWPLDLGWKTISSPFGYRSYPWSGYHTGLDIPATGGQDIFAANDGKIVTATWHSSYGYYVVIDHGGGIATLYAHCSRLLVKAGSYVTKGDVIALVGTTGASTGNHLHFEVLENGKAVNPLDGYVVKP